MIWLWVPAGSFQSGSNDIGELGIGNLASRSAFYNSLRAGIRMCRLSVVVVATLLIFFTRRFHPNQRQKDVVDELRNDGVGNGL